MKTGEPEDRMDSQKLEDILNPVSYTHLSTESRSGENNTGAVFFVEVSFNAHQSIESIGTVPSD